MSTLIYLLQVSACIAIFYGFYYFLLNRLTFFTINRYYLLGTLLLSFVIPLLTIHVHQQENYPTVVQQVVHVNQLQNEPAVTYVASIKKVAVKQQPVNWLQVLKVFYLLAAVGFLLHLIGALLNFFTKVRHSKIDRVGKVNILRGNKKLNNGSFLNYIFLNDDELSAEEMEQIIAHEMLHVKLLHSVDRIVAKLIQIILWFNPFVYLYARSIEENHEFEVDREVARSTDKSNYADLLLHLSIARQGMLYHSFSKVPLKKRIAMLFNKPSARVKRVVYVLILPVVMISCLAFARLKNDDAKSPDKKLYSVIEGIDKLGKNPVVEIDGKKYPKSILYKISWNCIERSEIYEPDNYKTLKSKGIDIKQWENGHVSITTKEHKITYQTAIEKENLVREDAIPKSQLYARLKIKTEKGYSEEVIVHVNNEIRARAGIDAGNKALFLIGDKRYDEGQMNKLPVSVIQSLSGMSKVGGYGDFPKIDTKGYEVIFRLQTKKEATADSIKYQQKMHYTPAQRIEIEKQGKVAEAYNKTPDAKYKEQLAHNIMGQTVNMKVTGNYVDKLSKFQGINVEYKGYNYLIKSNYGQEKALNSMLKPGDVVTIKVFSTAWREEMPVIISPAFVIKNDKKIFQLAEADKIPDYPFLYEANKVRFAEGQISHITNYPNGKWKTALFETVNGYKFNLSFKPDASDLESIKEDDHVRLRFVHEVKTGAKRYAISDWVSITTNMRDYGVKNPEWFFKFYEAAQTNVKVKGVAKSPVKKQYSTIAGLEKLGNNPMVLIDDKPYPAGILYQISPSCIKRKSVFSPAAAMAKKGRQAKDGLVEIITNANTITYLTPVERENVINEGSIPASRFYSRIQIKEENGKVINDKVIMHTGEGGMISVNLPHNNKAAFLIDGKLYDENSIKNLSKKTIAAITGQYSVEGSGLFPNLRAYTAIFTFNTPARKSVKLSAAELQKTMKVDTIVYDPKKIPAKQNATLSELLTQMPGLYVKDGGVFIRGQQVVKLLINGKTYTDDEMREELQSLPGNTVDKVQVINARLDDPERTIAMNIHVKD